jgi:hypothetical protein
MTRRIQSAEEISLTNINISSLDIIILAIILDTKQYIVKPVESTIQRSKKLNTEKKNYNSLSPLHNLSVECQRCNNYGHKASECRLPMQSLKIGNPNKQNNRIWKIKSELQSKKDDEYIAPEIDEVNNRRMVGKASNKEYKNQSFAYKVNQAQERRVSKEEYDTIVVLDDVLQINSPLANERKMEKENSKEEDE